MISGVNQPNNCWAPRNVVDGWIMLDVYNIIYIYYYIYIVGRSCEDVFFLFSNKREREREKLAVARWWTLETCSGALEIPLMIASLIS